MLNGGGHCGKDIQTGGGFDGVDAGAEGAPRGADAVAVKDVNGNDAGGVVGPSGRDGYDFPAVVFPNPTVGTATLSYFLPVTGAVRAKVVDAVGRRVVGLAAGERQVAGQHTQAVLALAPGLYTVRLKHEGGLPKFDIGVGKD